MIRPRLASAAHPKFLIRALLVFVAGWLCLSAAPQTARAGQGDEVLNLARHHRHCYYGDPERCHHCQNCQMSWQPIRSVMHPNMLPAGMIRPRPPYNHNVQSLIPKMPGAWLRHRWCGCQGPNCHCQLK